MNDIEIRDIRANIDNDTIVVNIWKREDVRAYLEDHDLPATKANIDAIVNDPMFTDCLQARLNELGYEVMEALIEEDFLPDKG